MNMKKLALAAAIATLSTGAFAAQAVDIDTGLETLITDLSGNTGAFEGTFQNLSINNTDLVDAAVTIAAESELLTDAVIETTGIGAVQSGDTALVVSSSKISDVVDKSLAVNTDDSSLTNTSDSLSTTTDNLTDTSDVAVDTSTTTASNAANTSSTAASSATSEILDTTVDTTNLVVTKETSDDINTNIVDTTATVDNTTTDITSLITEVTAASSFGVANVAYNNASIDASVDLSSNAAGAVQGIQLGADASIATTAIGAVQSGSITVTVQ